MILLLPLPLGNPVVETPLPLEDVMDPLLEELPFPFPPLLLLLLDDIIIIPEDMPVCPPLP